MHSVRSAKSYYVAAFVLGALIALLIATPARSAETFHPDGVAVVPLLLGIHSVADDVTEICGAVQ